ncbi:MAG: DASH family cryptochrome [Oceanicoccus sp.]|uniref:DASH family cryptochrome n=1 Tax=Oceanicoccus sp. TaxID=2691044 RepID=UPI0026021871|nr:DASH family cryptochrome [Oceanicoccus sp.]MDG1772625.1 DASH family cryptochrome [Oceanicoccus sp.]
MRALIWFTQDLRLADNPLLFEAHRAAQEVLHVVFVGDLLRPASVPGLKGTSEHRKRFLFEAIAKLSEQLEHYGHKLLIINGRAHEHLGILLANYDIDAVYAAQQCAFDETELWNFFDSAYPQVDFHSVSSATLFKESALPFSAGEMPKQFTPFRKAIEAQATEPREQASAVLFSKPLKHAHKSMPLPKSINSDQVFRGGEAAAMKHLHSYFGSLAPLSYKKTRNELQGFESSTRFSPWLAQGSLSAVTIIKALREYEDKHGANESTYWIYFELLWREFFFWSARQLGAKLFWKKGRNPTAPLTSFYPERFRAWTQGSTPWPLVNACMKELATTGYLSNRGRQVVASCLVNELDLDWRYGAAYFEQQLLDYDAASNWGNWQYLAGVGADPRGQRHFSLEKQTQIYDPDRHYIDRWQGYKTVEQIDTRDAADWPLTPDTNAQIVSDDMTDQERTH